jgi:hypothetical protein
MNQLLARCSETLLARLAGADANAASPIEVRLRAAQAIGAFVRALLPLHRDLLEGRFGLNGESFPDADIADRLGVPVEEIEALVVAALEELGWR